MTGLSAGMPAVHANATMWSLGTAVASAEETKTTIPISRTPKQISEFGLKPGKYRPPAVKVAGFDPLDANHAASTGVGSLPRHSSSNSYGQPCDILSTDRMYKQERKTLE